MQVKQRLDALTSLRFFAAAMIVIHHSAGLFSFSKDQPPPILWGQGVSFFFERLDFISADKLKGGESKLAIAWYQNASDLLPVDQGNRDWGGKQLILLLPH